MPFTDVLNPKPPEPPSTIKVVAIAAIVAFVIGCLPALGTALVVSSDFDQESAQRAYENCVTLRDGRIGANERQRLNKINLEADVSLYTFVRDATVGNPNPDRTAKERKLVKVYIKKLNKLIETKKDKILPLTKPLLVPNCEKQFKPPHPQAKAERGGGQ